MKTIKSKRQRRAGMLRKLRRLGAEHVAAELRPKYVPKKPVGNTLTKSLGRGYNTPVLQKRFRSNLAKQVRKARSGEYRR